MRFIATTELILVVLFGLHTWSAAAAASLLHGFRTPFSSRTLQRHCRHRKQSDSCSPVSFSLRPRGGSSDSIQGVGNRDDFAVDATATVSAHDTTATTTDTAIETAVAAVWKRHRRWSRVATARKVSIHRNRRNALCLLVSGSVFQTLAAQVSPAYGWALSLAGGVCLGAAPLIAATYLTKEKTSEWVRSRSVSEGIKAEVYLLRAGVAPYDNKDAEASGGGGGGGMGNHPAELLVQRATDLSESVRDLNVYYALTASDEKPPPPPLDRDSYIALRVTDQIENFYRKHARQLARKATLLKRCQTSLAGAAALIGLVTGSIGGAQASHQHVVAGDTAATTMLSSSRRRRSIMSAGGGVVTAKSMGAWAGALATASAAFGTHIAATKYEDDVMEWSTAAQRLENIVLRLPATVNNNNNTKSDDEAWSNFVLSCESIISSSTRKWRRVDE